MSIRSLIIAAIVCVVGWAPLAQAAGPASRPTDPGPDSPAVVIPLAGQVDDFNRDALQRSFDKARKLGAKVVILRVDTYGGLVGSGLDISRFIKNQTDLHTVAFVDSKAISAGAMIALACDEIVMMPSATLGDCAPIRVTHKGVESLGATERSKQESPILADFAESARLNGHDPLLARAMVSLPYAVHWVQNEQGERRFVDDAEFKALTAGGDWKPVPGVNNPIDAADTLLTVNTGEAIQYGLARGQATSVAALAGERGYRVVADLTPGTGEQVVNFLGNPWMRMILMIIFLNSLFIALHTPGQGAAEAVCVVALGVLVGVPLMTGYAQWWEIAAILVGLALVAFEIFVFPGHFVSIIIGAVLVLGGLLFTFVGDVWSVPGSWRLPVTTAHLERGLYAILGGLLCSMLLSVWLRRFLPRLPYFNRLVLTTTAGGEPMPAVTPAALDEDERIDRWPFIGTVGVAVSDLKPGGQVQFPYAADTRITDVVCETGSFVPRGAKVTVREVHGHNVVVRPVVG